MCRLYAQISPRKQSARDYLSDGPRSLLRQGDYRKRDLQADGWGIAFFDGKRPKVVKSAKAVFRESARFLAVAAKVSSKVVVGHLRAASNPLRSSKRELLRVENAQPFTDGRFIFAHNGTIHIAREVLDALGPYKARLRGSNDSEIYFWQFRKFYDRYHDVPRALEACVRELWALWASRPRKGGRKAPYAGLNTLISDGTSLHALCHFPKDHMRLSLFNPKSEWARMNFARRGDRWIVASEELDTQGWEQFARGEIVSARLSGGRIQLKRRRLKPVPA